MQVLDFWLRASPRGSLDVPGYLGDLLCTLITQLGPPFGPIPRPLCQEEFFYDTVDFRTVLARVGFPPVYNEQYRHLTFLGRCSQAWFRATRGLVQGCPCSPVLAACLTHAWQVLVATPGLTG